MILREIKLNPFAGMNNKSVPFNQGLNLILGPNEAGKSTIFHWSAS
jgi:DNA repair protein SbcC/Rad50